MIITLATLFYCCVMLFVSSFYHGSIFDPFISLWAFCFFLGGPILCLVSIKLFAGAVARRSWQPTKLLPFLFCLVVVGIWSSSFWRIGSFLRPVLFARVAGDNERLAVAFMQQHPPDTDFEVQGFRYPYCPIFPCGSTTVQHHAGVVSVQVPGAPSTLDYLVYVSPGSSLPYSPPTEDSMGQGFVVTPLTKRWYYVHAVGI